MGADENRDQGIAAPVEPGGFAWREVVVWLPAAIVAGGLVAGVATVGQLLFAPWIVFPLLVGVGLGGLLVGLVRLGQVGNRPGIVLGTVLAAAVAAAGQHYVGYLMTYHWPPTSAETPPLARQELAELLHREPVPCFTDFLRQEAARGRPLLFGYVARGWAAWLSWTLDAVLSLAAALAMVIPAMRLPYCNRCQSWYHVTRSGRVGASTARQLAAAAEIEEPEAVTAARYRLLSCRGGCGPTGLVLSWQEADGGATAAELWLDVAGRNRIVEVLDEERGQWAVNDQGRRTNDEGRMTNDK